MTSRAKFIEPPQYRRSGLSLANAFVERQSFLTAMMTIYFRTLSLVAMSMLVGCYRSEEMQRHDPYGETFPMKTVQSIECVVIDEAQRREFLRSDHNPPMFSANFAEKDFVNEVQGVMRRLKENLQAVWAFGFGDGDFFVTSDPPPDRFLCVEITNVQMLTPQMLQTVHDTISNLEHSYCVDVCDGRGFLLTDSGEPHPHFNVFVERHQLRIYSESRALLARLGLSKPEAELP